MSLLHKLKNIYNSDSLPEHDSFLVLLDKSVSLLENENPSYRPSETSQDSFSGGLIDFRSLTDKLIIVIPDFHARSYFLLDILEYVIYVPKIGDFISVYDALEQNLITIVSLGDIFHSENRCSSRWKQAYVKYQNGDIESPEMKEEVLENLKLLQMLVELKLAFPESFHILKGNHENILNENSRGNHPFYKIADEGNMFYDFLQSYYGDALIYVLSCFEHSLPVCAVFKNIVLSHAEPKIVLSRNEIINYHSYDDVVLSLTWTGNDEAEKKSVLKTIKNLYQKNFENVIWIGGHRPIHSKFGLRQDGLFVQIHNPEQENIAVINPEKAFDPDSDIFCVES